MSILRRYATIFILTSFLLVSAGLAVVDFGMLGMLVLACLVGIAIAGILILIVSVAPLAIQKIPILGRFPYTTVAIGLTIFAALLTPWAYPRLVAYLGGPCGVIVLCAVLPPPVSEHTISISPMGFPSRRFAVEERFMFVGSPFIDAPEQHVQLPKRLVLARQSGVFLKRVSIAGNQDRTIDVETDDGRIVPTDICGYHCPTIKVELLGFPKRAFFGAATSAPPVIPDHPDPVDISWEIPQHYSARRRDVAFWYFPSDSAILLRLPRELLGAAAINGLLIAVVACLLAMVWTLLLLPVINERYKAWLKRRGWIA